MSAGPLENKRILIVDDNEDIHQDFRRILSPDTHATLSELDALEAEILGTSRAQAEVPSFELTSAFQGAEALSKVQQALKAHAPFALAFIDVRMPPGWDGIETLTRLWQEDPRLQAVICSAYSDYSWEDIRARFGQTSRLLILKKPFDASEVRQLACALLEQWNQASHNQLTEESLRRAEAQLHALLQAIPDTILRVAVDGTCQDFKASPASPQPTSAAPAGGRLGDRFSADTAQRMLAQVGRALGGGSTQLIEYEHPVAGEAHRFEARIAAIDAREALVLLRDVTERKRPEAAVQPQGGAPP
jgi:CheY-like chemotaxis protein